MKNYYVYIITNFTNSTLYIGVTNNLERRLYEHKNKLVDGFSKRYNLNKLVYFEETTSIEKAIERKKATERSPFFAFYSLFCPIVFSLYGMCVSAISSGLIP